MSSLLLKNNYNSIIEANSSINPTETNNVLSHCSRTPFIVQENQIDSQDHQANSQVETPVVSHDRSYCATHHQYDTTCEPSPISDIP